MWRRPEIQLAPRILYAAEEVAVAVTVTHYGNALGARTGQRGKKRRQTSGIGAYAQLVVAAGVGGQEGGSS